MLDIAITQWRMSIGLWITHLSIRHPLNHLHTIRSLDRLFNGVRIGDIYKIVLKEYKYMGVCSGCAAN